MGERGRGTRTGKRRGCEYGEARRRLDWATAWRREHEGGVRRRPEWAMRGGGGQVAGPGEPAADFMVQGPRSHGVKGLVNLFGIESPGLTASLALADVVASSLLSQPDSL